MKIYNKIPWGLALGTLGITAAGRLLWYGTVRVSKRYRRSLSDDDCTLSKTTEGEKGTKNRIGIEIKIESY